MGLISKAKLNQTCAVLSVIPPLVHSWLMHVIASIGWFFHLGGNLYMLDLRPGRS